MWKRWVRYQKERMFWGAVGILVTNLIAFVVVVMYSMHYLFGYTYLKEIDFVRFQTAAELAAASPVIVKATATADAAPYDLPYDHYTKTKVTIEEVLKDESGSLQPGEKITVLEQYWMKGRAMFPKQTVYNGNYYSKLVSGTSYLLYLAEAPEHDSFQTVAFHQGKYNLDRKDKLERRMEKKDPLYGELKQSVQAAYADKRETPSPPANKP
ncbi:hypothetical protein FE783_16010 [Paenibacillus mesophilus]|uniref:hypothetical protein n=1 Tax=Paenibacillus mesophilus TaxID=2582849 RepID=UPI00110E5202|nr:hypothetical protein [Paenibacillus mesophilus]TMV48567.1 hypothetical protein FE783_16010 [Paenibacillus mesophilus]